MNNKLNNINIDIVIDMDIADSLIKKADKIQNGGFFYNLMHPMEERREESLKLFERAANIYKLNKYLELSMNVYLKCANLTKDKIDSVPYYLEIATMQRKNNTSEAIKTMNLVVNIFLNEGKNIQAAKILKEIGQIYESTNELSLAVKYYDNSVNIYENDIDNNNKYITTKLLLKIADLKTIIGEDSGENNENNNEYIKYSINIYESVAYGYLENKLTYPCAKELFLKAALLHLVNNDFVGSENAVHKYVDLDPTFKNSREHKFIEDLIKSVDLQNIDEYTVDVFSEICCQFDELTPLDNWKIIVLNRIKNILINSIKSNFSVM